MKPQLSEVFIEPTKSLRLRHDSAPINNKLHYHEEVELIHFIKGEGTQFVGDSVTSFVDGDMVLVGANLPHHWRFNDCYYDAENPVVADIGVIQFSDKFLGEAFLSLPENKPLKVILEKSKRGIKILGKNKNKIAKMIDKVMKADGAEGILYLIHALIEISKSDEIEPLSSLGFVMDLEATDCNRIRDIFDYSFANFRNKINLEEIADVANISPNSFCRYFKSKTKKTYSRFLTEIKVGQACKLLIDNSLNIKQICYESGFNNFASFHKSFKSIMGKSPLLYQKEFIAA
jgi:AraC-like DNA-binding protein